MTMEIKYHAGPHLRSNRSTMKIMMQLTLGLLVLYIFSFMRYLEMGGAYIRQVILIPVVSVGVAVLTEVLWAAFYKKDILSYLKTSFPWVTGLILALALPINTRLYVTGVASFISIFFAKLVFGGFGQNVFNPAAVGRTLILIGFGGGRLMDVVASPTPTTVIADNGWLLKASAFERFLSDFGGLKNMFMGNYFGAIGETSTILILIIGIVLAALEVFDWMIPAVYLGCIFIGTFIIGSFNGVGLEYALFNCLTGGVAFGAVFMLTDPITNPNTRSGRVVFAAIAAFVTMLIRFRASLPEGVGYTILLVNILTPVIEKYFDGKTTDRMHKDLISVIVVLVAAVVGIVLVGLTLKAGDYSSVMALTDILKGGLL